jgi:uncharacterized membrane protein YuzA (DUF378 family)
MYARGFTLGVLFTLLMSDLFNILALLGEVGDLSVVYYTVTGLIELIVLVILWRRWRPLAN